MEYKDCYEILGVPKGANEKETKRAYRRLACAYYPDKNPHHEKAKEKFTAKVTSDGQNGTPIHWCGKRMQINDVVSTLFSSVDVIPDKLFIRLYTQLNELDKFREVL